ncbi:MAG TPA: hypothetical protein VF432_12075 [Thermoanaerobaculia bacterium]
MRARTLVLPLFLFLAVGCATQKKPLLPVPEALESAALLEVKRNRTGLGPRPMSFGEWQVNGFDRKGFPGNRSWSVGGEDASYGQSRGFAKYSFRLTPAGREEWECDCRFDRHSRNVGLGSRNDSIGITLTYEDSLQCDLRRAGDADPWKLVVDGSLFLGGQGYAGTLTHGDHVLHLQPNHQITGLGRLPGSPLGYVFVRDRQELAAAELIHPGYVRIDDTAGEDRDAIATAAAALLMQPSGF